MHARRFIVKPASVIRVALGRREAVTRGSRITGAADGFSLEIVGKHHYRFTADLPSRRFHRRSLNKREFGAVSEHMRVEGINLKRVLEARHEGVGTTA